MSGDATNPFSQVAAQVVFDSTFESQPVKVVLSAVGAPGQGSAARQKQQMECSTDINKDCMCAEADGG
jgi:hypothetical protein